MAQLYNYETGQYEEVDEQNYDQSILNGTHSPASGEKIKMVGPTGEEQDVDAVSIRDALDLGFKTVPQSVMDNRALEEEYGSSPIKAAAAGAARGLTFGISDQVLTKTGAVRPQQLRELENRNIEASLIGEIGSIAVPMPKFGIARKIDSVMKLGTVAKAGKGALKAEKVAAANLKHIDDFWNHSSVLNAKDKLLKGSPHLEHQINQVNVSLGVAKASNRAEDVDAALGGMQRLFNEHGPSLSTNITPRFAPKMVQRASQYVDEAVGRLVTNGKIDRAVLDGASPGIIKQALIEVGKRGPGALAGGAVEGSAYGIGHLISEDALGRKDLNAENVLAEAGFGALLGGAAGVLLTGAGATGGAVIKKFEDRFSRNGVLNEALKKLDVNLEKVAPKEKKFLDDDFLDAVKAGRADEFAKGEIAKQRGALKERVMPTNELIETLHNAGEIKRRLVGVAGLGTKEGAALRKLVTEFEEEGAAKALKKVFTDSEEQGFVILREMKKEAKDVLGDTFDNDNLVRKTVTIRDFLDNILDDMRGERIRDNLTDAWLIDSTERLQKHTNALWDVALKDMSGNKILEKMNLMPDNIKKVTDAFIKTGKGVDDEAIRYFKRIGDNYAKQVDDAVKDPTIWSQDMHGLVKGIDEVEARLLEKNQVLREMMGVKEGMPLNKVSNADYSKFLNKAILDKDPEALDAILNSTLSHKDFAEASIAFIRSGKDFGSLARSLGNLKASLEESALGVGGKVEDILVAQAVKGISKEGKGPAELVGGLGGVGIGAALGADAIGLGLGGLGVAKGAGVAWNNWPTTLKVISRIESAGIKTGKKMGKIIRAAKSKKGGRVIPTLSILTQGLPKDADKKTIDAHITKQFKAAQRSLNAHAPGLRQHIDLMEGLSLVEHAPKHGGALMGATQNALDYLADTRPKAVRTRLGRTPWVPTEEKAKWLTRIDAVHNPMAVMEKSISGRIKQEELQAVKAVYPQLYESFRMKLLDSLLDDPKELTFQDMLKIERNLDLGIMDLESPAVTEPQEEPRGATPGPTKVDINTDAIKPGSQKTLN